MSSIIKNHRIGILTVFLAASLFVSTLAIAAISHDNAFATSKKVHVKKNGAAQETLQAQSNRQSSACFTGGISLIDCNNVGLQFGINTGNSALGQK